MPLLLVRHARAGDRDRWEGDDRQRPLDARGLERARDLVALLAPYPVDEILTSPALRCIQTVEPLAVARGLDLRLCAELTEERQSLDGGALVRSLAAGNVVVCGHGGLEGAVVDAPRWRKGAVFVLDGALRIEAVL